MPGFPRLPERTPPAAAVLSLVAAALAGTACGTLARHPPPLTRPPAAAHAPRTAAGNRRAAERDVRRLLALVAPPPGAVRVRLEPRGDGRLLNKAPQSSTGELIDRHMWWRTRASFSSVVAYLEAHRPRSARQSQGSGAMGGPGIPRNYFVEYDLPPVPGVIASRSLIFWVSALSGGGTGVRVDAQDVWIVPRPASERIPAAAKVLEVTSARPHERPIVSLHVTAPAKLGRIVALLNAMPRTQPGAPFNCPMLRAGQPTVTFAFRTRVGGPLLARASATDYGFPSGPCNPVSLSIRGHPGPPLVGGDFLERVQRLLRVNFR